MLERVRATIRKAVPGGEDVISHQIPAYKCEGQPVLYFAAWRSHYSIYPSSEGLLAAFGDELARYEVRKGTIRFPLSEPVPTKLIAGIAGFRAKEAGEQRAPRGPAAQRGREEASLTAA